LRHPVRRRLEDLLMDGGTTAHSSPPEPSFAERARTLLHVGRLGTLATLSRVVDGCPFASVAPYGLDHDGRPTFLFSTLAVHTQNLAADARASLLVTAAHIGEDALAQPRATLLGRIVPIPAESAVRQDYLARHQSARRWVGFADFRFYRLEVLQLHFVAGFGAMGWVTAAEYAQAAPDPLADSAAAILEHMNADHPDALVAYCRAFGNVQAEAATMTAIDRLGFGVRAQVSGQMQEIRVSFPHQVGSTDAARRVLIEMLQDARSHLGRQS
jgi:putative heme iron utilization protein